MKLRSRMALPYTPVPVLGGTPLQPWMSLARTNRHPRDNQVHFDEPTHVYTVNGNKKGFISVSGLHHHLFPEFDADKVIKNMMKSKNWPNSKWFGMSPKAIKEAWNANGREASEAGTEMHLAIEKVMNGAESEVPEEVKQTKEWEYFWNYWREDSEEYEPWRTEWEVWDEEHKITGSIDMIYRNKNTGEFAIYDWKRAKEIKMDNDFQHGFGPVKHLPDTNYWHYTIQLNLYRWLLQKHYGIKITELALVVMHPNNKNYKKYVLNILDEEVEGILAARMRAVQKGLGAIYEFEECEEDRPVSHRGEESTSQRSKAPMFLDD